MAERNKRFFLYIILILVFLNLFMLFVPRGKRASTLSRQVMISSGTIPVGGSLYASLINEGVTNNQIYMIKDSLKKYFNPRRCQAREKYEVLKTTSSEFLGFRYYRGLYIYEIEKSTSGPWVSNERKIPLVREIVGIEGEITTSLWESMQEKSCPPELIMDYADIFAWQVDFLTEPRKGDKYRLIWERYTGEEGIEVDRRILAAWYLGGEAGENFGFRFNNDYYDKDGHSLRKFFLRAPLNYRRISSHFSHRRFHPILKYYRPHLGIDYAAPIGTPVVSIGDGRVSYCGWKGDNGRLVIIRHNSVYTSSYGHLSRYGRNIKKGTRVKQDQVIGYVGSTGLSTGPHLDFRVRRYGKFVNFLRLKFPSIKKISKDRLSEFTALKQERLTQLATLSMGDSKGKVGQVIVISKGEESAKIE